MPKAIYTEIALPEIVIQANALAVKLNFPLMPEGRPSGHKGPPSACIPQVGKLLPVLASGKPNGRIGEQGTGAGVGTAWLACGLRNDARLVSVEINPTFATAVTKYIDFKAPTVAGDTVRLFTLINNKIALIDLWGSWCGPCIAKSRTVVPIYQKYKSKGFEVVGIAREFKSTDAVKRRLAKEQFSWTNLVELDDHQNVWNQYGISNGAGLMVLVDRNGVILAIDPKPEELEKILQEKL